MLLLCVAGNAGLNWVLIYGHLGAPALGMAGSGYASAINQWVILAGLALCTRMMPGLAGLHLLRSAFTSWTAMANILRLGLPIGGIMGVEVGVFLAAGVLMGLLGAAPLGAHQLVLNCAGISFMVPLGLGQAATVRVAYELGAGRALAARRAGFVALALGIGFMGATAVVLWTVPQAIIAAYIDIADPANRETVQLARRLLVVAALFQVVDGMQVIAAGALRGYKDTLVPMLLAGFGYWGAGFVGGWLLAFPLGYGAVGLWWGLALGLAVVALLLTLRLHRLAPPVTRAAEAGRGQVEGRTSGGRRAPPLAPCDRVPRRSFVPEERPDLDCATRGKRQFLGDRDCGIEIRHVDQVIAAELLLGFGKRAVMNCPVAVTSPNRSRGGGALQPGAAFSGSAQRGGERHMLGDHFLKRRTVLFRSASISAHPRRSTARIASHLTPHAA